MLCNGGTYLEIGNINQRLTCEFNPAAIVHGGKSILGLMWYRPESLRAGFAALKHAGRPVSVQQALIAPVPLSAIDEAFREQDAGAVHRAALLPWEN